MNRSTKVFVFGDWKGGATRFDAAMLERLVDD
jgi:hypothetical protein